MLILEKYRGDYKRAPSHSLQTLICGCHAASVSRCSLSLCVFLFLPPLCVVFTLTFEWTPHHRGMPVRAVPSDSSFLCFSLFLPPLVSLFLSSARRYTKRVKKGTVLSAHRDGFRALKVLPASLLIESIGGELDRAEYFCSPSPLHRLHPPFSPHRAQQASAEHGAAGMPIMRCGNCDWVWFKWFQMLLRRHQAKKKKKTAGSLFHWYEQKEKALVCKRKWEGGKHPTERWSNTKNLDDSTYWLLLFIILN